MSQLFNLAIVGALCNLLSFLDGFHEAAHSTAPRLSWNKWVGTEQEHPGRNDQWGQRWTFSNNLHHQRKCIMEQGLCSHFLLFIICFLISSAHVTHGTFLAPQLQDALAAAFTLSFQKNSPLIFWQLTGIIHSARSLQCLPLPPVISLPSYCSTQFL